MRISYSSNMNMQTKVNAIQVIEDLMLPTSKELLKAVDDPSMLSSMHMLDSANNMSMLILGGGQCRKQNIVTFRRISFIVLIKAHECHVWPCTLRFRASGAPKA